MGWLIDPEETVIFVYQRDATVQVFEDQSGLVPTPEFANGARWTVRDIFDWLKI